MIAIDTNVLVRALVEDDREQARRVRGLLSRHEVSSALRALTLTRPFVFGSRSRVLDALDRFDLGKADLSDYLVLGRGADARARTLYTFDRQLLHEAGVSEP